MTPSFRHVAATFCVALVVLCGIGSAAEPARPGAARPQASSTPLRQIELGDQVRVEVFDSPDLNTTTYVADDGAIRLPLVGAIRVKGRSPAEAAEAIEAALKEGQFLIDPHVTVTLVEAFQASVTVLGEVSSPGRYEIGTNFTALDALALAGGVTEKGGDTAYILRPDDAGVVQRVAVPIDPDQLLASGQVADAMLTLRGGDSILVPKATFTITGQIQSPGEYRIERGMVLFEAIARAGGVTPLGSASRVEIRRRGADDKIRDIKGKRDTPIQPGDVIRVKERLF